ncbi:MAG: hypothetical protein HeimAB125_04420 [Candidatus Heimdallarchaeota archaeon AB_125]|nr:MAG: hypothetical protein HeimAB125_04420 [Candidatus Heimdallarchaeota archaeon AB_125]
MKVLNRKLSVFLFTFLLLFGSFWIVNKNNRIVANPLNVFVESAGGLLPGNDTDLQMVEANVVMDIDETYGENGSFAVSFDGNYTIFNPNETLEIMIGAPFLTVYEGLTDSLKIEVDGIETEYDIVYYNYNNDSATPWMNYFQLYIVQERYFAICNITFSGQSNTTIRYRFDSITNFRYTEEVIWITYDVGTARAWDGLLTEYVEFNVYGKQPTYYYNNTANTTVTEIENGKSYLWSWEKIDEIRTDYVFIEYFPTPTTTPSKTSGFWLLSSILCLIVLNSYRRFRKTKTS